MPFPPIKRVKYCDRRFPRLLKEIPGMPETLYYLGTLPENDTPLVAVVGTRKAGTEGKLVAKALGYDLAKHGIIVVSGLALGIDAAAHEGALGGGKTVAVLANGLDTIYPPRHEALAAEILKKGGCILSEYPEGTPPYPNQFLERNRIVSGLALATVVVEAPLKSGALVTARHAAEQGREVFVVPGPAHSQNYRGSHLLIRNGARLATNAEDILEDLEEAFRMHYPDFEVMNKAERVKVLEEKSAAVLTALKNSTAPLSVDKIAEAATLEPYIVQQELASLVLEGFVEEIGGKFKAKP